MSKLGHLSRKDKKNIIESTFIDKSGKRTINFDDQRFLDSYSQEILIGMANEIELNLKSEIEPSLPANSIMWRIRKCLMAIQDYKKPLNLEIDLRNGGSIAFNQILCLNLKIKSLTIHMEKFH